MNKQVYEFSSIILRKMAFVIGSSFILILGSCNLAGDIDKTYTVTFNGNGGTPEPDNQTVNNGGKAVQPADPQRVGYAFGGWYKEPACVNQWDFKEDAVIKNITLYAQWLFNFDVIYASNPDEFMAAINIFNNGTENRFIIVTANIIIDSPVVFSTNASKAIIIRGEGINPSVVNNSASSNIPLFSINGKITMFLDGNITLNGNNRGTVVRIENGGNFTMRDNSAVTGGSESGIYIDGGTFNLLSGTISGNKARALIYGLYPSITTYSRGGGIYMENGALTITGGAINDNEVTSTSESHGGGIYMNNGTLTMAGGMVNGNVLNYTTRSRGGGIYIERGTFTMTGGAINSNEINVFSADGGGIHIKNGNFTMTGGAINDNKVTAGESFGGGVYNGGTFTMSGGTINGNKAVSSGYSYGGGVSNYGTFIMSGGTISGNSCTGYASYGGGVCVYDYGFLNKTGGIIDALNSVTATSDRYSYALGRVAYVNLSASYGYRIERFRNSAAGHNVNLYSSVNGAAGGWE